jgi:hypothetical protein
LLILLAGVLLAVVGCAENKLTRRNYDMIYEGKSTMDEVRLTMGEDHLIDRGDHWEYEDMDRKLSVVFYFDDKGKVSNKQWRDGKTGEWDGADSHIDQGPEGRKITDDSSNMTIDKE